MTNEGDARLLSDLQMQRFADLNAIYGDAISMVTVFTETAGMPAPKQFRDTIGRHPAGTQVALTAASRLAWELLTALAAAINVPAEQAWRLLLEHRAKAGYADKATLIPPLPNEPLNWAGL